MKITQRQRQKCGGEQIKEEADITNLASTMQPAKRWSIELLISHSLHPTSPSVLLSHDALTVMVYVSSEVRQTQMSIYPTLFHRLWIRRMCHMSLNVCERPCSTLWPFPASWLTQESWNSSGQGNEFTRAKQLPSVVSQLLNLKNLLVCRSGEVFFSFFVFIHFQDVIFCPHSRDLDCKYESDCSGLC